MTDEVSIMEKCQNIRNEVLEVIIENFDYFRENKSHLPWALMNFDLIHRASRLGYDACLDNANDLYRLMAERIPEEDEALLSDAWDMTQNESEFGNYQDFNPHLPVEQGILDYHSSMRKKFTGNNYPTEEELIESASYGQCETPLKDFAGYTVAEENVRPDIRKRILTLTTDSIIKEHITKYKNLINKTKK